MTEGAFTFLYLILFLASLVVIFLLGIVLYRTNRILKHTEKVTGAASEGFSKLITAALSVVTVSKGLDKVIEILEGKFTDKDTKK